MTFFFLLLLFFFCFIVTLSFLIWIHFKLSTFLFYWISFITLCKYVLPICWESLDLYKCDERCWYFTMSPCQEIIQKNLLDSISIFIFCDVKLVIFSLKPQDLKWYTCDRTNIALFSVVFSVMYMYIHDTVDCRQKAILQDGPLPSIKKGRWFLL